MFRKIYIGLNVQEAHLMDAKTRIKELMDERGWTIYEMSKRSGLAQTVSEAGIAKPLAAVRAI